MNEQSRRNFIKTGAATAAAIAANVASAEPSNSANERFVIAVLGVKGRGRNLASIFAQHADVEIAYLCDPDESLFGPCLADVAKHAKSTPKTVQDFRRALDDKNVDGIVVATPDHWHALATIWGCMADKHVYVEKPCSHNLVEGRRMVEAARKYKRAVQVGTQRRASPVLHEMVEFVRSGAIGKINFARTWTVGPRKSIGYAKDEPAPKGVDYDMWLGPAPSRPFNANRFHYNWHWFWDYGAGELGNNGIHGLDLARWTLDIGYPTSVVSSGGKHHFDDDQETPDTQIVAYEYPGLTLVQEHRTWSGHPTDGSTFGACFCGDQGTVTTDGAGWQVHESKAGKPSKAPKLAELEVRHERDWMECAKSGARPKADIEIGHISTALCHIGNISQRLGRKLAWDGAAERFPDADANALLGREYRKQFALPTLA